MSTAFQTPSFEARLKEQLADRRARLQSTIDDVGPAEDLLRLLTEVDQALGRIESGMRPLCVVCETGVQEEELAAHPGAAYCLCDLTPARQRALERDLDLAWRVQSALLPKAGLAVAGWQTDYRYVPEGPVSGDYCDLIASGIYGEPGLYFMVGDVSGKGVAASLLMAHLNAALRTFAEAGLTPEEMLAKANRVLAESTLASHYATLVCGVAGSSGEVRIANAGHCPPMVVRRGGSVETVSASGLPLGLALGKPRTEALASEQLTLRSGDMLVLYTDGLTEAANSSDEEFGTSRLRSALARSAHRGPRTMVADCLNELAAFLGGRERHDDLTLLALARQ